eukprot:jgi/Bigna1/133726/aug1.22_g8434
MVAGAPTKIVTFTTKEKSTVEGYTLSKGAGCCYGHRCDGHLPFLPQKHMDGMDFTNTSSYRASVQKSKFGKNRHQTEKLGYLMPPHEVVYIDEQAPLLYQSGCEIQVKERENGFNQNLLPKTSDGIEIAVSSSSFLLRGGMQPQQQPQQQLIDSDHKPIIQTVFWTLSLYYIVSPVYMFLIALELAMNCTENLDTLWVTAGVSSLGFGIGGAFFTFGIKFPSREEGLELCIYIFLIILWIIAALALGVCFGIVSIYHLAEYNCQNSKVWLQQSRMFGLINFLLLLVVLLFVICGAHNIVEKESIPPPREIKNQGRNSDQQRRET